MTLARRLLRTPSGAFRAPWRLATFAAGSVAGLLCAQALVYPMFRVASRVTGTSIAAHAALLCVALLIGHAAALRGLDERPWSDVGLGGRAAWSAPALALGLVQGVAAVGLPVLVLVAAGWLRLEAAPPGSSLALAASLALHLAPGALFEELAYRGYVLNVLRDAWGTTAAIAATSVAFALLHLVNAGATALPIAVVMVAGAWLATIRVLTASLWAAWVAHLAWNWTLAALWHAPVSGIGLSVVDYRLVDSGPDWATGGAWGPEGGVIAALGLLGGTLYLHARPAGAHTTRVERA